ncbi:MAG TPA: glycine cleavage T C-terminal barrel domain-containing protein [Candidatus Acidoferrales bacterium]|nr:glycine cleavage T C-terminal barrel domain-containing protein [Candidatus Acidoferrales bacterium]
MTSIHIAIETLLRAEHEKLGAHFAEYFGCVLPANYGDAQREYKFARESVGLIDTNFHAVLSFAGNDRVRYLNAMLTGNIRDLLPGRGDISLLLSPQGRILAEVETLALEDRFLVISHAMIRARLIETFDKFIIMDDVTLEDCTDKFGTLALEGPQVPVALRELCGLDFDSLPEFAHTEKSVAGIPCRIIRHSCGEIPAADLLALRENLPALWNALLEAARAQKGGPVGYEALNILRLEEGVAWYGADFDENQIPHQAALESTHISYTKGCYTGQEIVERVRSRGQIQRRRVMLRFVGDAIPHAGEPLFAPLPEDPNERDAEHKSEIGLVTRAARSPKFGAVIGMGYVRREQMNPGSKVKWSGGDAEVFESPVAHKKNESCA